MTDCADYPAGRQIDAINTRNSMHCDHITVSDYTVYGLMATIINTGNSTDCAEDDEYGQISDIDAEILTNCADISI